MHLSVFFADIILPAGHVLELNEINSRHMVQVLRMQEGEDLHLTDGKGHLLTATITRSHKKHAAVLIKDVSFTERTGRKVVMAVSLLKNASRLEWFMEKAAEMGVQKIVPLICERTEKQHGRLDRFKNILESAMLQSQQVWMTELAEPQKLQHFLNSPFLGQRYVAHCVSDTSKKHITTLPHSGDVCMLIGPEGDFSPNEIQMALEKGYISVSLGETRLRTETAALVSATILTVVASNE